MFLFAFFFLPPLLRSPGIPPILTHRLFHKLVRCRLTLRTPLRSGVLACRLTFRPKRLRSALGHYLHKLASFSQARRLASLYQSFGRAHTCQQTPDFVWGLLVLNPHPCRHFSALFIVCVSLDDKNPGTPPFLHPLFA